MFTNPFSVLQQNIRKVAANNTYYPDEDAINCLFVMYSGNAENYTYDEVSGQILNALQRASDYSHVKLCYAVLYLLSKSQTVTYAKYDVSSLPYHFLRYRQVFNRQSRTVPYALTFSQMVESALASAQLAPSPTQQGAPRNIPTLIQTLRACGALCQHDDTDQLLLFLKNQSLKYALREVAQLLTACASCYTKMGNIDYIKPHLPDLRLGIRALSSACSINGIQAQIADIPELLESMARGKFSNTECIQRQQSIMQGVQTQQQAFPMYQQALPVQQQVLYVRAPQAVQYTQPVQYYYYYNPAQQFGQPGQIVPQYYQQVAPQYLPQQNFASYPQMAPYTPYAFNQQVYSSPRLAGSYGPAYPQQQYYYQQYQPGPAPQAYYQPQYQQYQQVQYQPQQIAPYPQYQPQMQPFQGQQMPVQQQIYTAPAAPYMAFNAPQIYQFQQPARNAPAPRGGLDDLLGM